MGTAENHEHDVRFCKFSLEIAFAVVKRNEFAGAVPKR